MNKILGLLCILFLSGCAGVGIRTYSVEQPRVDTEVTGNQGYLLGKPPAPPRESRLGPTRRISVVELEYGTGKSVSVPTFRPDTDPEDIYIEEFSAEDFAALTAKVEAPVRPPHKYEYQRYVVQEDDTLQKISLNFYGTTRRWMLLYEENKDVLKSPDEIYPGIEIKVPVLK